MRSIFLISFFISFLVKADITSLTNELLKVNFGIKEKEADLTKSQWNINQFWAQRPWILNYNGLYSNDKQAYPGQFSNRNAQTQSHGVIFSKKVIWGGEFYFDTFFRGAYRSDDNIAIKFGEQKTIYEFYQTIGYRQDFGENLFGRQEYKDLEIREQGVQSLSASVVLEKENKVLEFFNHYINARHMKSLIDSEKMALGRAKARTSLIKKMVKDGLRLDVDLMQAKMAEVEKEEAVNRGEIRLTSTLEKLSNMLHRKIFAGEIKSLDISTPVLPYSKKVQGELENNKNIVLIEENIKRLKLSKQNIDYGFAPNLKFKLDFKSNSVNKNKLSLIKDGNLLKGKYYDTTAQLNLSWPLGFEQKKVEKATNNIALNVEEMRRNKTLNSFKANEEYIKSRLQELSDNIKKGKKRWNLSRKVIEEYNRLYHLGRTSLIESLRAEDNRILTERSFLAYLAEKESLVASLIYLWGELSDTILNLK